jgi:hypothetical protein
MPLSEEEAERLASICMGQDVMIIRKEEIAMLWGGMARIYRVCVKDEGSISEFVVKNCDHTSRSCRLAMSDKRKIIESYENEANFYQHHSEDLRKNHGIALPKSFHVESGSDSKTTIVCMSMLQKMEAAPISSDRRHLTVELLATFHAVTWQRPFEVLGCFWHYDTRPSVWKTLSNQGLEGRLKRAAKPLDEWLKNETSLQSWIHGDCKEDNVLWDEKSQQVALCDFQYVGRGCPCKDLAYFLTDSCCGSDENMHDSLVDVYFQALLSKLPPSSAPTRPAFDVALELAYCDYLRFLCAWRGQHKQQKERITPRVQITLDKIDGGSDLGSEDDYRDAIHKFAEAARYI